MTRSMPHYLLRETAISMVINTLFSLAFFLLVFKIAAPVPGRSYAVDFLPQSFAIALMSTLVPGAIAARNVRLGRMARWPHSSPLPRRLWQRTVLVAVLAMVLGGGALCGLMLLAGPVAIAWWPALVAKLAYGAALAAVVTPPTLKAALR